MNQKEFTRKTWELVKSVNGDQEAAEGWSRVDEIMEILKIEGFSVKYENGSWIVRE